MSMLHHIHTTQYWALNKKYLKQYSAKKKKKKRNLPIHTITLMNLKYITLSEKSQTKKATYHIILFIWHFGTRKNIGQKTDQWMPVTEGRDRMWFKGANRILGEGRILLWFDCDHGYIKHLPTFTVLYA